MAETEPRATYQEPSFRTYPPEWVDGGHGEQVLLQRCEELVEGRWEPFVATLGARQQTLNPVDEPTA
jgi:hypothetical protein